MRRTGVAAVICLAGLLAGCGSNPTSTSEGTRTSPTPTRTQGIATTGNAGSMTPAEPGKYNATFSTVRTNIEAALVDFFDHKGFSGVTADCKAVDAADASCKVTGTSRAGLATAAVLTISVNQRTGMLRITDASG